MQWFFWLLAILLSAGAGYWVYNTDKRRAIPYPWLTALLRGLVIFFTLLLLLAPVFTITKNETEKPVILLLQDNSRSVGVALGNDSSRYRKDVQSLAERLGDKYKVVQWGFGSNIVADSVFNYRQPATDIATALQRAQEFFGMQNLGAVVLATDGRFNQGANPVYQQLSLHSPLYTVAIGDSNMQKDLRVSQVYANRIVSLNSQFEIRADIVGQLCQGYNNSAQLTESGTMVASVPVNINTDRFDRSVSFTIKADKKGLHHYVVSMPVADGEKNTANNRKDIFVEVTEEKKNILIVSASPDPDVNAIKEVLSGVQSYKVTVKTIDDLPSSLNDYQVVILHGLPSHQDNIIRELKAARKPAWYIVTSQTNQMMLNDLQKLGSVELNTSVLDNLVPMYNTSFSMFTLPQNIQSVMDKMPPLSVPIGNIKLAPNTNVLFYQKGSDKPLWILHQATVPTVMTMGEDIWRWRLYEYKNFNNHEVVDECVRQTVAFLAANNNDKPFRVTMPRYVWSDDEAITMNAYLLNANNEQVNTPDAQLTITDSAGRKQNYSFERSGNVYALNIGVWASGTYNYSAKTTYDGKPYEASGSFAVESMPLELMESGADYPLLYSLAKKYDGALIPAAHVSSVYDSITRNENIKPVIQTNTETVPLIDRKWYFFLILLVAVGEWLLRKYWLAQ